MKIYIVQINITDDITHTETFQAIDEALSYAEASKVDAKVYETTLDSVYVMYC